MLLEDKLLTQEDEPTVCLSLGNWIIFAESSSYTPLESRLYGNPNALVSSLTELKCFFS